MKKLQTIQVLRVLSILLIFLSHCSELMVINGQNALSKWGGAGVSIFVAISGFLSAYNYLNKENVPNSWKIYKQKWKKYGLVHLITLVISIPLMISLIRTDVIKSFIALICNGFLIQAFVPVESIYFSYNAVSWYLSLTIFFAVMIPICVQLWKRMNAKSWLLSLIAVWGGELLLCIITAGSEIQHWLIYICPVVRFFEFFVAGGAYKIFANYDTDKERIVNKKILFVTVVVIEVILLVASTIVRTAYFSSFAWFLPSIVLVVCCYFLEDSIDNNLIVRVLMFFGGITFEFFMLHQLVIKYISAFLRRIDIDVRMGYLPAFIIAVVSAYGLNRLNKYIFERRERNAC